MGWALTGSRTLCDQILLEALGRNPENPFTGSVEDPFENFFIWAFRTLDDACSVRGVIRPFRGSRSPSGLIEQLHSLPYELRVATVLLTIEAFTPEQAEALSGRSAFSLASAAVMAGQLLDDN